MGISKIIKSKSIILKGGGCGCILIILGLLGFKLFGAPSSSLILIGLLVLILGS
jgi:hypothetical protein